MNTLQVMLPAHAGMTPSRVGFIDVSANAPRACRDDPATNDVAGLLAACSPEENGINQFNFRETVQNGQGALREIEAIIRPGAYP